MHEVTVCMEDGRDLRGDTVRFRGDELQILGVTDTVTVAIDDVRSIIAGRPADAGTEVLA